MSALPLRSIEAFVAVARAGTLARAATMLNITVPAVSRRIAVLEDYLRVALFHRLPRGLALTEAGERYFAELAPAWERAEQATRAARRDARETLKVSVIPTFAANWLMPRLAGGRAGVADLEIETAADMVDLQARSDLDCAIRLGRPPWQGLESERLLTIDAYPVASPAVAHRGRSQALLQRHTLIGSAHQPDFWQEWSRLGGMPLRHGAYRSFDNLQLVYEAAAAGIGIAIGLGPLVQPYLAQGRLVALGPSVTLSRAFHLVRPSNRPTARRFAGFRDWLREQAARAA